MTLFRKTILITGASSGIGAGMAREFAAQGHDLVLCARRTERLDELSQELTGKFRVKIETRALDVNNHEQVFSVFEDSATTMGGLDRVIVNAGVGEGRRVGTGHFDINKATASTNFIAALAQCEAAVGIFRRQNAGHLVVISSMSAMRGLPKHLTAYAASKAGLAHLAEGIRADLLNSPIKVTTVFPGYIRTELNAGANKLPFEVDEQTGSKALVRCINREPVKACVPGWPWTLVGFFMRHFPLAWINKLS